MTIPWQELGLSRFAVVNVREMRICESGRAAQGGGNIDGEAFPRVVYSDQGGDACDGGTIDLRLLARVLRPTLCDHRLETVCTAYSISGFATDWTRAMCDLFAALLDEAIRLDREIVALLARLLPPPLSGVFDRVLLLPGPDAEDSIPESAVEGSESVVQPSPTIMEAFAPQGPIARAFPRFDVRSGQLEMAKAVERVFAEGGVLLTEAGPGTGKTFAYLVPVILHLRQDPRARVIVSTRTKHLQEQLYTQDLPFLISRLAPNLKTALLKGRENYLCLRRWQTLIGELSGSFDQHSLTLLAPLARWIVETDSGDIEENTAFLADKAAQRLWRRLCDTPHHCVGTFCPYQDDCFSVLARRAARKARVVVVNHSLLLGDLAVDGVVLGRYSHLVVDEAHGLEAAARDAFSDRFSERIVTRFVEELASPSRRRGGWLQRLPIERDDGDVQRASELASALRMRTVEWLRQVSARLPSERRGAFSSLAELDADAGETLVVLEQLASALDRVGEQIEEGELLQELEGHIRSAQELSEIATQMNAPPGENTVHWFERTEQSVSLFSTPMDVAPFLKQRLYPGLEALVLTSATLSVSGDFGYLRRSLGLSDTAFDVVTQIVDGPFRYRDRMRIIVPSYLPPVTEGLEAYADELADLVTALVRGMKRKGLVLFTSYQMLHAVRERLPADVMSLAQGIDGPRSTIAQRFRAHRGSGVLLGTESFWEGVDFPGEQLEFLVITRLPFPVPTDPILSALGKRIKLEGGDPFSELSLPLAVLRLRQGVGRLIRTETDRGMIFLTDQRILTRPYGARFTDSLPVPVTSNSDRNALLADVLQWFDNGRTHRCASPSNVRN